MEVGRILGIAYNVIPAKDLEKSAAWFVKLSLLMMSYHFIII